MLTRVLSNRSLDELQHARVRRSAESDLRRILALGDPPREARLALAKLLTLPNGDRHEARRQLDVYLQDEEVENAERAEALILRGRVQRDPDRALADFDEAIQLAPDNADYKIARVLLLRAQKKLDEALASLDEIVESDEDNAAAMLLSGQILRAQGKFEAALAAFDQAHQAAPDEPEPLQQRGEVYRQLDEFDKAVEQFTELLDRDPDAVLPRIHRAEALHKAERPDEALADIDALLEQRPNFVPAARLKAEIYASQDDMDQAIAVLDEFSRKAPHALELSLQLALYQLVNKRPEEAIEAYSRALIADNNNYIALRGRGDAYLNIGDHHAALEDFERAIAVRDDDPELLNNLAWLLATSPDDDVRDGQRAIGLATKAGEATEFKRAHVLSTLAAAYAETGDFQSAREWSQKAVDMNDPIHGPQLAKELESYQQEEPWRERQNVGAADANEGDEKVSGQDATAASEAPIPETD